MSEEQPQVNGPSSEGKYIDQIDPDDPEYIKEMRRPAEVKEDVRGMETRKRVSLILGSQAFKDELEQIVQEQLKSGSHPASLMALQTLAELFGPHSRGGVTSGGGTFGPVVPIADIRGVDSLNYAKGERLLRCKLAACYRLVDQKGWTHSIYNHITLRINQDNEHFLINPFGMMYSEITAASLVKVDMQGDVLDSGSTNLGINKAGFTLHSAIHAARPDIRSIIHVHTAPVVAVSVMKCGLLPVSQEACVLGDVTYYEYSGILLDLDERDKIARALGPVGKVMFLRNHGVITCGESIEEAYHLLVNVVAACETQLKMMPIGIDNMILIPEERRKQIYEQDRSVVSTDDLESKRKFKYGELEFEALMRQLDNAGYRTGYVYREPLMKREKKDRTNSDVEEPPVSSSFTYVFEEDREHSKYSSPIKQALEKQKKQYKQEWLNTPNVYRKEEIEEIGTPNPKKITKWIQEANSPTQTNTPIKIEKPNQFAPQGDNPKEFRNKQKQIRGDYYTERIHAGPQSRILEGMSWEEAQKVKDGNLSGTADSVIVVGAASKGIIQRDHQHNAVVYKTYYAANPFDKMTEDEIDVYKKEIERKARGEPEAKETEEELEPGPDGRLISTEERMHTIQQSREEVAPPSVTVQSEAKPVSRETNIDEVFVPPANATSTPARPVSEPPKEAVPLQRSSSARKSEPPRSPELVQELEQNFGRSKSERRPKNKDRVINGDEPPASSPAKSDTLRSNTSDEGLEEGSPAKGAEQGSPTKEKKKKKKFRMPSFSKKKEKK